MSYIYKCFDMQEMCITYTHNHDEHSTGERSQRSRVKGHRAVRTDQRETQLQQTHKYTYITYIDAFIEFNRNKFASNER